MDAPHNFVLRPVVKTFVSLKPKVHLCASLFNPEQIMESLFLENRCKDTVAAGHFAISGT